MDSKNKTKTLHDLVTSSEKGSFQGNGFYGGHTALETMVINWRTAIIQDYKEETFKEMSVNDINDAIAHLQEIKSKIISESMYDF